MTGQGAGIRFLDFEGYRVAYAVIGDGPPLVAPAWWVSHLEMDWRDRSYATFWELVAEGRALVLYDRPGVGMSDRETFGDELTLDFEVSLVAAVMDELDLKRATLVGGSSGGCTAVAFAARFPERVDGLLLYGAYAHGPSIASPDVRDAILATVRSHWGLGSRVLADIFLGEADGSQLERFGRVQRESASADMAVALLEATYLRDVRADLERVCAPTLVVHRRGDRAIPFEQGQALAATVRGARLIPLEGKAHLPWAGDFESVARALRSFLSPAEPARMRGEPAHSLLSAREREILSLIATGLTDGEIAQQLVLSQHTVKRHVANIRHKLGRGSRTAAVVEATRLGLL